MDNQREAGRWLADLIEHNIDSLVAHLIATARAVSPQYQQIPDEVLVPSTTSFYRNLIQAFTAGKLDPARPYLEGLVRARVAQGVTTDDLHRLIAAARADLRDLIAREGGHDRRWNTEVTGQMEGLLNSLRMILSEMDMRLRQQAKPDSGSGSSPPPSTAPT
jgi:hypothetical protein